MKKALWKPNVAVIIFQKQSACCILFPCMDFVMEHLAWWEKKPFCVMCRHPIAWVSNFWANNSGLTAGREKHGSEPPLQLFAMQALCSFYSPSDEQRWRKWSNGKGKCITIPSDQCKNRVNLLNNPSSDAALGTSGNVIPFVIQLYLGLSQMVPPILCFLLHHSSVVLEAHHHKWTNENTSAQLEASGWDEDLSRLR